VSPYWKNGKIWGVGFKNKEGKIQFLVQQGCSKIKRGYRSSSITP
jgi:hypothetical protein